MKLYMPTKVIMKRTVWKTTAASWRRWGQKPDSDRKAFLTDQRLSGGCEGALERERIPYVIFDEIEENPSVETVMKARALGVSEGADFVIGVGGGSPMDASKAISLMMANPEHDERLLYTKVQTSADGPVREAFPVLRCPPRQNRSEVTPYAILTKNVLPDIVLTTVPLEKDREAFAQSGKTDEAKHQPSYFPGAGPCGRNLSSDGLPHRLHQYGGGHAGPSDRKPPEYQQYGIQQDI